MSDPKFAEEFILNEARFVREYKAKSGRTDREILLEVAVLNIEGIALAITSGLVEPEAVLAVLVERVETSERVRALVATSSAAVLEDPEDAALALELEDMKAEVNKTDQRAAE